ncbi:MAG TPA: MarR family transcriptional regulator [Solirubrobacteraceae bacterium]|nr:MarR family transcriptional regulator [Solirubrobacteraceae bacterium]
MTTEMASTESRPEADVGPGSAGHEAWALLRELLFAERRRFFEAAAEFELHPAQAGTLMQLDEGSGLPMHEIATRLACDNSNVTGIVDRLEARGLVTRRPGEQDRRVKYVVLTPLGVEMRRAMGSKLAQVPVAIERLSAEDQRVLRDVLARATGRGSPA